MLRILLLTVFSISLFAKEMPLVQEMEFLIPYKKFFVIEFPFEIKDIKLSPFKYRIKNILDKKVKTPKLESKNRNGVLSTIKTKLTREKKSEPVLVTKGKNFLEIYANRFGYFQVVVWGYKKYPLLLSFKVNSKKYDTYIKFTDNETSDIVLKKSNFEKICSKLIYALYNNKKVNGYKTISGNEKLETKLKYYHIKSIIGKKFAASEFVVENNTTGAKILNEYDFIDNYKNVYAVSVENRNLKPNESAKIFIVYGVER